MTSLSTLARQHPLLLDAAVAGHAVLHPWVFRVAVTAAALLGLRRRPRKSVTAVVALIVGGTLGAGLKLLFARPRPELPDPVSHFPGYSMPSGHALNAALGVGLLLWLAWPWLRGRAWWVAGGLVIVVLTGLDRLLLAAHYPSDVLVGWLVGAGVVAVAVLVTRRTGRAAKEAG